ncbi:MAG: IclR family transcriptional regulator [Coriobacteriia bacterium]|nr:IclR family transcriptional regulator [Coriobacteriia bacterium]
MASAAPDEKRETAVDLHVRSVTRAVSILDQFTLEHPHPSLSEISNGVGLSKSTTHRLLSTLQSEGMVDFDRRTARYRLGLRVFRLGSVAAGSLTLIKEAEPLMRSITDEIDETSLLLVADGSDALCVGRFDGREPVRVLDLEPGRRAAFNCGAAQRVLLAHLPDRSWEEVVERHVVRMTEYSLLTVEELERDRREIRERGYSVGWEDRTRYACSLGAPVRDAGGSVIAAVSISGIVQRFSAERLPSLIRRVMQLGDDLSSRVGCPSCEKNPKVY